jgi:hypothetical protein
LEHLCDLLFEVSNEDRLGILYRLEEEAMNVTGLARALGGGDLNGLAGGLRHPFLGYYAVAVPFASLQVELADLGHVSRPQVEGGGCDGDVGGISRTRMW